MQYVKQVPEDIEYCAVTHCKLIGGEYFTTGCILRVEYVNPRELKLLPFGWR